MDQFITRVEAGLMFLRYITIVAIKNCEVLELKINRGLLRSSGIIHQGG